MNITINHNYLGCLHFMDVNYFRVTKDCVHIRYFNFNVSTMKKEYKKQVFSRVNVNTIICDYCEQY